jgi:sulfur-carrier protein
MKIQVFGRLTDIIGSNECKPEGVENTDQLKKKLLWQYPGLTDINFAIAVNDHIIRENHPLQADDEVALLPPYSGG